MAWLLLWLGCGVAAALILQNKGHSPIGGFFLGALFGPIGVLVALLFAKRQTVIDAARITAEGLRKCPDCAELVKAEAVKCRYCGAALPAIEPDVPPPLEPMDSLATDIVAPRPFRWWEIAGMLAAAAMVGITGVALILAAAAS